MIRVTDLVKVVGELYYWIDNPLTGKPTIRSCLVGEDLKLYQYSSAMHTVHPFSRDLDPAKRLAYDDKKIEQLLHDGLIEFEDGTVKLEQTRWI